MLHSTVLKRIRVGLGIAGLILVLLGCIAVGARFQGASGPIAVIVGSIALGASSTWNQVLSNLTAGAQVRASGDVEEGASITIPGPTGPFTGRARPPGARSTHVIADDGTILVVPNSALNSSSFLINPPKEIP